MSSSCRDSVNSYKQIFIQNPQLPSLTEINSQVSTFTLKEQEIYTAILELAGITFSFFYQKEQGKKKQLGKYPVQISNKQSNPTNKDIILMQLQLNFLKEKTAHFLPIKPLG